MLGPEAGLCCNVYCHLRTSCGALCCLSFAANPTLLELQDFRDQVLAPFVLSEAQHAEACTATISHDQPLPQPDEDDWNLAGGSSAAGGGQEDSRTEQKRAKL